MHTERKSICARIFACISKNIHSQNNRYLYILLFIMSLRLLWIAPFLHMYQTYTVRARDRARCTRMYDSSQQERDQRGRERTRACSGRCHSIRLWCAWRQLEDPILAIILVTNWCVIIPVVLTLLKQYLPNSVSAHSGVVYWSFPLQWNTLDCTR